MNVDVITYNMDIVQFIELSLDCLFIFY